MSKKFELASFDVVADTNALYAPALEATWESCCGLTPLALLIPEIVKQERVYQLCTKATEAMATASKSLSTLKGLCGFPMPKLPTERQVQTNTVKAFEQWLDRLGAVVVPTHYATLDWHDLVRHAVWRIPPFSPSGEKGFRDYLVMHSLKDIYSARKHDKVAFLCNDKC